MSLEDNLNRARPATDPVAAQIARSNLLRRLASVEAGGPTIGRFRVLERVGEGAYGVVYSAYDPQLDRRVALKRLRRAGDAEHRRMVREARALARLSHPNVVGVYEVGEAEGYAYVAMEFVEGMTLERWLVGASHTSAEIVEVLRAAGRGLAEAHDRGLVHGDFKPSNVMVGTDGRVRVTDFGLARAYEGAAVETTDEVGSPDPLGDRGTTETVLGTPAYMAPEQHAGHRAGPRCDQYGFCVTAWEALTGQRLFESRHDEHDEGDGDALLRAKQRGPGPWPPDAPSIEPGIVDALRRGLAVEPDSRWPTMNALLARLQSRASKRDRARAIALVVSAVTLGGAGLVALGGGLALELHDQEDRCSGARAELSGIWDDARRQEVERAILSTELSYAPGTWERVEPRLDDYARAWADKHTEVCEATSVREEQTEDAMGLRMGCLRKRKTSLNAAVKVLVRADEEVVGRAVDLVTALPGLGECDDVDLLEQQRRRVPLPEDPRVAQQVETLRKRLVDIKAVVDVGKYTQALEEVESVVAQAEVLGYVPLRAEALVGRGIARIRSAEYAEAEQDLEQGFELAAEHGHDTVVAAALAQLTWVVGYHQARYEEALGWGKTALAFSRGPELEAEVEASALNKIGVVLQAQGKLPEAQATLQRALAIREDKLGPTHPYVATSLHNLGGVLASQGKASEALTYLRRALAIREDVLGPFHPNVAASLNSVGVSLLRQGKLSEALEFLQRALAILEDVLGPTHPDVAMSLNSNGLVLWRQGKPQEALAYMQRALAIKEDTLGPTHPDVAGMLNNIGGVLRQQGRFSESLAHMQRALAIWEDTLGPTHPDVASVLNNIGGVLELQGNFTEALAYGQRALSIKEAVLGPDHPKVAASLNSIGHLLLIQGELPRAQEHFQRALAIREDALGSAHPDLAHSLVGLAKVALELRRFDIAHAHAERTLSLREAGEVSAGLLADARFVLARALWPEKSERPRARALAEQARDAWADVDVAAEHERELDEVEQWLAEHRVQSRGG